MGYLVKNFYRIDRTTTIDSSELNPGQLLAKDLTIDTNVGGPVILIYHTHSQEGFVDSDGSEGIDLNICATFRYIISSQSWEIA